MKREDIIEIKVDGYRQRMREMAEGKTTKTFLWGARSSPTDMFDDFVLEKLAELEARLDEVNPPDDLYPNIRRGTHSG